MKKLFNFEEFFTFAESKEDAIGQYVQRQRYLTGDDITEFKEDNIYDALYPFFKAVAERFGSEISSRQIPGTETKVPRLVFKDFIFGKELSLELVKDVYSDGFTLKLIWKGEKKNQLIIQVLDYINDIDAMEHQIRDAISTITVTEAFYE